MSRSLVILTLALAAALPLLASGPAPAHAQKTSEGDEEQARRLHQQGLRQYQVGDYASAIESYRKAYTAFPAPGILFNLAHAYRLSGDCVRAVQTYKSFMRAAPASKQATVAAQHVEELGSCSEPAKPENAAAEPSPDIDPEPEPEPEPESDTVADTDASPAQPGRTKRIAGLTGGGVGIALLTVGVVYGLDARDKSQQVDQFFATGGQWDDEHLALEAEGKRSSDRAMFFSAMGGAALVAGGIVYWLGRADREEQRASRVAVHADEKGASFVWSGSF